MFHRDSLYDFTGGIQHGATLDTLYNDAPAHLAELTRTIGQAVIRVALASNTNMPPSKQTQLNQLYYTKVDDIDTEEYVDSVNKLCGDVAKIVTPQIKDLGRARLKQERLLGSDDGTAALMPDVTRGKVIAKTPTIANLIAEHINEHKAQLHDGGWKVTPQATMSRALHVNTGQQVSQIIIHDESQHEANKDSHKVYRLMRDMRESGYLENYNQMPGVERKDFRCRYNDIMAGFSDTDYAVVRGKKGDGAFRGRNIQERYKDLFRLHQSIHLSHLANATSEWKDVFLPVIAKVNRDIGEKKGIPNELLEQYGLSTRGVGYAMQR